MTNKKRIVIICSIVVIICVVICLVTIPKIKTLENDIAETTTTEITTISEATTTTENTTVATTKEETVVTTEATETTATEETTTVESTTTVNVTEAQVEVTVPPVVTTKPPETEKPVVVTTWEKTYEAAIADNPYEPVEFYYPSVYSIGIPGNNPVYNTNIELIYDEEIGTRVETVTNNAILDKEGNACIEVFNLDSSEFSLAYGNNARNYVYDWYCAEIKGLLSTIARKYSLTDQYDSRLYSYSVESFGDVEINGKTMSRFECTVEGFKCVGYVYIDTYVRGENSNGFVIFVVNSTKSSDTSEISVVAEKIAYTIK